MAYYGHHEIKDGKLYIFNEYCAGGTLTGYLRKHKSGLSELTAMEHFKQLLSALEFVHRAGIIHRDLKPDNVLLDSKGDIKIADFGLARELPEEGVAMTKGAGTPLYEAPEVYSKQNYGKVCDVWSAGALLHHIVTGEKPFKVTTAEELKQEHLKYKNGYRIKYPATLSHHWEHFTNMMLVYDPAQRPEIDTVYAEFLRTEKRMKEELEAKYNYCQDDKDVDNLEVTRNVPSPYDHRQKLQKPTPNEAPAGPDLDRLEESYKQLICIGQWLTFFRLRTDFLLRILTEISKNQFRPLKNVIKYMLMVLSTATFIKLNKDHLRELETKVINIDGRPVSAKDLHPKHHEGALTILKGNAAKVASLITRYEQVLKTQLLLQITTKYSQRPSDHEIITSFAPFQTLAQELENDDYRTDEAYTALYRKILSKLKGSFHLNDFCHADLRTYLFILIAATLNKYIPNNNYKENDFVKIKKQQI